MSSGRPHGRMTGQRGVLRMIPSVRRECRINQGKGERSSDRSSSKTAMPPSITAVKPRPSKSQQKRIEQLRFDTFGPARYPEELFSSDQRQSPARPSNRVANGAVDLPERCRLGRSSRQSGLRSASTSALCEARQMRPCFSPSNCRKSVPLNRTLVDLPPTIRLVTVERAPAIWKRVAGRALSRGWPFRPGCPACRQHREFDED